MASSPRHDSSLYVPGACRYAEVVADGLCLAVFRQSAAAICWALKCQVRVCVWGGHTPSTQPPGACVNTRNNMHALYPTHTTTHTLTKEHAHTHTYTHTHAHTEDTHLRSAVRMTKLHTLTSTHTHKHAHKHAQHSYISVHDMPLQDILMAHDWDPELLQHELCEELAIHLPVRPATAPAASFTRAASAACLPRVDSDLAELFPSQGRQLRQVLMRGLRTKVSEGGGRWEGRQAGRWVGWC